MHPKEFKKVKNNTGFMTHISLLNSELFIGVDFTHHQRVNEIITTHESYVLYPGDDAIDLTRNSFLREEKSKRLALFLIDATWACAKSIFKESKNIHVLPKVSFSTHYVSRYEIKKQPAKHCLSTIETTEVVLRLLDLHDIETIDKNTLEGLLLPFVKMIEYQKECILNPKSNAVRYRKRKGEVV